MEISETMTIDSFKVKHWVSNCVIIRKPLDDDSFFFLSTLCRKVYTDESVATMLWGKQVGRFMWKCGWRRIKEIQFMWEPETFFLLGHTSPFSKWLVCSLHPIAIIYYHNSQAVEKMQFLACLKIVDFPDSPAPKQQRY